MLELRGFAVVAEADGAKARLEAAAVAPEAGVLDIHLPEGLASTSAAP